VILTGNEVFVRVSGYELDALVGKPHNIIRHPDVPRAVFRLLWDYLEAGRVFAGFRTWPATAATTGWWPVVIQTATSPSALPPAPIGVVRTYADAGRERAAGDRQDGCAPRPSLVAAPRKGIRRRQPTHVRCRTSRRSHPARYAGLGVGHGLGQPGHRTVS
jgi:hypothetical protein